MQLTLSCRVSPTLIAPSTPPRVFPMASHRYYCYVVSIHFFFGRNLRIYNTPLLIKLRANNHHQICGVQFFSKEAFLWCHRTQYSKSHWYVSLSFLQAVIHLSKSLFIHSLNRRYLNPISQFWPLNFRLCFHWLVFLI